MKQVPKASKSHSSTRGERRRSDRQRRKNAKVTEAERFLKALDPQATNCTFQTFDDNADRKDPKLVRILHGTLAQHEPELRRLSSLGAGIFVTVNETDGKGRRTGNVKRVRAVWADLDGADLGPVLRCGLKPHVVVQTSPGRFHCYWFVDDLLPSLFWGVQKAIVERFDSASESTSSERTHTGGSKCSPTSSPTTTRHPTAR